MQYIFVYLIIINLVTCILYGVDKLKAVARGRRTPERVLLGFTFVGGSLGALVGMQVFRHKTRHLKFQICVPLFMIIHIALIIFACVLFYK
ncbi:MAG: DUF1294 domain-containing protein [Lachnospiraceae bacterium]|nr:DUF1294 domain-containing protein [Lachnospiraceae bacterium]